MATDKPLGPVMLDVSGLELTRQEQEIIDHPNTGAVILFSRNYHDPAQLILLVKSIRAARKGPILIAVDQEGGRVQRFQYEFTRLPPAGVYVNDPVMAETAGWVMAAELLAVGVDFSFAPVLDVDCGISQVIGNRSFSLECQQAGQLASAFRQGMKAAGMAATGKHFPGHGAVAADSHVALPIDERDYEAIKAKDLLPFKRLIDEGLEAVMPAHVIYRAVDPNPAGFSPFWIRQVLRSELGFNGVVFSDDLSMAGAAFAGDYPDRARLAQSAGCDMLLVCNNPAAAESVIDSLPIVRDEARERRLAQMAGRFTMDRPQLMATEKWQQSTTRLKEFVSRYA